MPVIDPASCKRFAVTAAIVWRERGVARIHELRREGTPAQLPELGTAEVNFADRCNNFGFAGNICLFKVFIELRQTPPVSNYSRNRRM
jgi:hypothetical protein